MLVLGKQLGVRFVLRERRERGGVQIRMPCPFYFLFFKRIHMYLYTVFWQSLRSAGLRYWVLARSTTISGSVINKVQGKMAKDPEESSKSQAIVASEETQALGAMWRIPGVQVCLVLSLFFQTQAHMHLRCSFLSCIY